MTPGPHCLQTPSNPSPVVKDTAALPDTPARLLTVYIRQPT